MPVRTTLLQNIISGRGPGKSCDYQSERHCSKTIGAKSPLQRTIVSGWPVSLTFKKVQVNDSFYLMFVDLAVMLVFKKQNLRVLMKNLLDKHLKVIF